MRTITYRIVQTLARRTVTILIFVAMLLGAPAALHAEQPTSPPQNVPYPHDPQFLIKQKLAPGGQCIDLSREVRQPIFHGLKRIYLYVDITPNFYDWAVRCHGHEGDCVGQSTKKFGGEKKAVQNLINLYNAYPETLHRDDVTNVFVAGIRKHLFPFLQPGPAPSCMPPDVQVLDSTTVWNTRYDSQSLLVWVFIDILDNAPPFPVIPSLPRLAIVRYSLYRSGLSERDRLDAMGMGSSVAFTLDLPEEQIQAIVKRAAKSLFVLWGIAE